MNSKQVGLTLGVVALVTMGMVQDLNNVINDAETLQSSQSIGESKLYEYSIDVNNNYEFVTLAKKAVKEVAIAVAETQPEIQVVEEEQLPEDSGQDAIIAADIPTEAPTELSKKNPIKVIEYSVEEISKDTNIASNEEIESPVVSEEEPVVEESVAIIEEPTVSLSTLPKEVTLENNVEPEEAKIAQTVKVSAPEIKIVKRWATANINIRTGASLDYPVIGVVTMGTELEGKINGDWFEFNRDEQPCFLAAKYLSDAQVEIEVEEPADSEQTQEVAEEKSSEENVSGWITTNLNVRKGPSTDAEIIGSFPKGTLIDGVQSNGWIKVNYNENIAYISAGYLSDEEIPGEETVPEETVAEVKIGRWLTTALNVRTGPGTENKIIGVLPEGTYVEGSFENNWLKIDYQNTVGYVSGKYLSETEIQKPTESKKEDEGSQSNTKVDKESQSSIDNMVDAAWSFVGYPYVYGEESPEKGFDCSGLTYYLYKEYAGVTLNRVSGAQMSNGYSVSKDSLQPGDLVFFTSDGSSRVGHVGIYVGDRKFIHASTPATGVKVNSVDDTYYTRNFAGARRIID